MRSVSGPLRQDRLAQIVEYALLETRSRVGRKQETLGKGGGNHGHSLLVAQLRRSQRGFARQHRRLMHQIAYQEMSQQDCIEFLEHAGRRVAAQRSLLDLLVLIDLSKGRFNVPSIFVVCNQFESRSLVGVQQGGHEPIGFARPWQAVCARV